MEFELFLDAAGEWRFRLRAANGEIVAASEGYANQGDALATVAVIQAGAASASVRVLV